MRFCLFVSSFACTSLLMLAPGLAHAQSTAPASPAHPVSAAVPASSDPLVVMMPPGATVALEVDGRDSDLLGMVKTLLSSFDGAINASTAPPSLRAKKVAASLGPLTGYLSGKGLGDILKDVRHLHIVAYDKPRLLDEKLTVASLTPPVEGIAFHEPLLVKEGGRRLLYLGHVPKVLLMGFDAPRGMAVVVDDDDTVVVARTEGYVDVKALTDWLLIFAAEQNASAVSPARPAPKPKPTAAQKPRRSASVSGQK